MAQPNQDCDYDPAIFHPVFEYQLTTLYPLQIEKENIKKIRLLYKIKHELFLLSLSYMYLQITLVFLIIP